MSVTEVVTAVAASVGALTAVVVGALTIRGGQHLRIQAEKQSIDARAPIVVISLRPPDWPPYESSVAYAGVPQRLIGAMGDFRLPQMQQRKLMIAAKAELRNIGASPAHIALGVGGRFLLSGPDEVDALVRPELGHDVSARQHRTLNPGDSAWAVFMDERTVQEWREHAVLTPDGVMATRSIVVTTVDVFDRGVTDTQIVLLHSRPIVGVAHDAGLWRPAERHLVTGTSGIANATAQPVVRTYWRSRANQRVL